MGLYGGLGYEESGGYREYEGIRLTCVMGRTLVFVVFGVIERMFFGIFVCVWECVWGGDRDVGVYMEWWVCVRYGLRGFG
jgi:hypothetical protein